MTQNLRPTRLRQIVAATLLLLSCQNFQTNAQVIQPPSGTNLEGALGTSGSLISVDAINCDMMDLPPTHNKLVATVFSGYDQNLGAVCSLKVEVIGAPAIYKATRWYALPAGATKPDVAIINDNSTGRSPLNDFRVYVVYETSLGNVELNYLQVTGAGSSATPFSSPGLAGGITLNTQQPAHDPHIDASGDAFMPLNGGTHYAMHEFAVCWVEPSLAYFPVIDVVMVQAFTIPAWSSSFTPGIAVQLSGAEGMTPDIACRGHKTNTAAGPQPTNSCYLVYKHPPFDELVFGMFEFDKFPNNYGVFGGPMIRPGTAIGARYGYPRIEAIALGDKTLGYSTWEIVTDVDLGGGFTEEIETFNDASGSIPALPSNIFSLGKTVNHINPVVAGVGRDMNYAGTAFIGNDFFTVSYYADDITLDPNGSYFTNSVDILGGTSSTYTNYMGINDNSLLQPFNSISQPRIAVTSCSNTGNDLYTVWYEGSNGPSNGDLKFKYNNTNLNYNYKTANSTPANIVSSQDYKLAPNPAKNVMEVYGVADGSYTITDMMGRIVKSGSMSNNISQLDVSNLQTGNYILNITENKKTQHLKFVKQ